MLLIKTATFQKKQHRPKM